MGLQQENRVCLQSDAFYQLIPLLVPAQPLCSNCLWRGCTSEVDMSQYHEPDLVSPHQIAFDDHKVVPAAYTTCCIGSLPHDPQSPAPQCSWSSKCVQDLHSCPGHNARFSTPGSSELTCDGPRSKLYIGSFNDLDYPTHVYRPHCRADNGPCLVDPTLLHLR